MFIDNTPLSEATEKALSKLKYTKATDVQKRVIPLLINHNDVIVQAETGSGKTASFAIPICENISWEENHPQALIISPTRELAAQIREECESIGRYKRIHAALLTGKQSFAKQKLQVKQKTHIVVGTPGRVLDHIKKQTLPIDQLQFVVIDEADEMLDMGFIEQVQDIIESLNKERVTAMFSATMPDAVRQLASKFMNNPEQVTLEKKQERIEHLLYEHVQDKEKLLESVTIVRNPDACIIFCQTKHEVDERFEQLVRLDYPCAKIHGDLTQEDRFAIMESFKRGEFRYLVATDVAARGIDVDGIDLVINYDEPTDKRTYLHRAGRTGRAGKRGTVITFLEKGDSDKMYGQRMPLPKEKEIEARRGEFEAKLDQKQIKQDKTEALEEGITKIYFNGGKKKKLRAVDFVGTIAKIDGVSADDIGIITILHNETFIDILNHKGEHVIQAMRDRTVKGKQLKVHRARL